MKIAMLLISMLFLATAVEALPGGGGRQLGKGKKPNKKCKVDVCWKKCQKLKDKEEGSVLAKVLGSKCDIAFMEDCLEGSSDVATCKADCKDVFNKCRATVQVCKKNLKTCMKECKPKTLDCSKTKGEKKKKCCEKKCEKSPDIGCIETCIAA